MKLIKLLTLGLLALVISQTSFADTDNLLVMYKQSVLTGDDAINFAKTFGRKFKGNDDFSFYCRTSKDDDDKLYQLGDKKPNNNPAKKEFTCFITAKIAHFKGDMAEKLLDNNATRRFVSKDKTFGLHCKNTLNCQQSVERFCYIKQKYARLEA